MDSLYTPESPTRSLSFSLSKGKYRTFEACAPLALPIVQSGSVGVVEDLCDLMAVEAGQTDSGGSRVRNALVMVGFPFPKLFERLIKR